MEWLPIKNPWKNDKPRFYLSFQRLVVHGGYDNGSLIEFGAVPGPDPGTAPKRFFTPE